MSRQISILETGNNKKLVVWEKDENASNYEVVGMDGVFALHPIKKTKDTNAIFSEKELEGYIKICVKYMFQDKDSKKEFVIDKTDYADIKRKYEKIELQFLKSYKGIAVSFISEEIYDKFCFYERTDDGDNLIAETEDFQVCSELIKEGNKYYVEAYKKKEDTKIYDLTAMSDVYTCTFKKFKKASKIDLSIVIPVYNGEVFFPRNIDSILFSNFDNYEIIIVNDGSKDNTQKIIDWYKKKYKERIVPFYQENQGLSFARNSGIKLAKGKYVAFIDSDDMVHPYMYRTLVEHGLDKDLDVVLSRVIIRNNLEDSCLYLNPAKEADKDNLVYSFEEMIREREKNSPNNIYFVGVWNKIQKAEIVKAHPFPNYNRYEDNAFTMAMYSYCNTFGFCRKAFYMWDKRFRSTIGTYSTSYNDISGVVLNINFVTSSFNASKVGNPDRMNYLSYYSTIEIFNLLNNTKTPLFANNYSWSYIFEIKELNKRIDLLKNPYIKNNPSLLSFVEKALNYKSV